MKSLEEYGPALVSYEGVAELTVLEEPGTLYKGYFEAKQLTTGGIAIGFQPVAHDTRSESKSAVPLFPTFSFRGRDVDGWDITDCGESWGLPIFGPPVTPKSAVRSAGVFRTPWIKCKRNSSAISGYDRTRYLLSNLLWHYKDAMPEPITLSLGNWTVTISACDEYLEAANSVKAVHGIAATAEALVQTSDASKLTLDQYNDFMDDLVSVFRLATGNKIDWFFAEGLDSGTGRTVERFHKDAITGPFSNTFRFRGFPSGTISIDPMLNLETLAVSFFDANNEILDRSTLKKLINYFVNACDETSYLEARGLLASTLLDLIVLKYTKKNKAHNVIKKKDFKKQIWPLLKKGLKNVKFPEPSNELRERAREQLQNVFRKSFRTRLDLLAGGLNLPSDSETLNRAVKIRNKLVHHGTYFSDDRFGTWYNQYKTMIWINLVALCRLTGYKEDLPTLDEGGRLEVQALLKASFIPRDT